jgi:hypothetical protein
MNSSLAKLTVPVLLTIVLAGSACKKEEAAQTPPANPRYDVTLDPDQLKGVTAAPLEVTVSEDGKPVTDAEVSVELRMPPTGAIGEMRTGTELTTQGNGRYSGTVDLHMAGKWNAIVRVKRGGQLVATYNEPVEAVE